MVTFLVNARRAGDDNCICYFRFNEMPVDVNYAIEAEYATPYRQDWIAENGGDSEAFWTSHEESPHYYIDEIFQMPQGFNPGDVTTVLDQWSQEALA